MNVLEPRMECFIFDPKQVPFHRTLQAEQAYAFWKQVWVETFSEVNTNAPLFSDEFTKHDEWIALFFESNVVGLFGLNWYWCKKSVEKDLKYWSNYPSSFLELLGTLKDDLLMSMSYLTVDRDFRRRQSGLPVSDWLVGLAIRRFLTSKAKRLITYTRNDRKTHELGHRHGGVIMDANHIVHGIGSDVLCFDRSAVLEKMNGPFRATIDHLLESAQILSVSPRVTQAMSVSEVSLTSSQNPINLNERSMYESRL